MQRVERGKGARMIRQRDLLAAAGVEAVAPIKPRKFYGAADVRPLVLPMPSGATHR